MGFADQLKKARISKGFTQQQIADIMGVTNSTYCGYETGKRKPDVEKIKILANILDTSGDFLLEIFPDIKKAPPSEDEDANMLLMQQEAIKKLNCLNPSNYELALDYLDMLSARQGKQENQKDSENSKI